MVLCLFYKDFVLVRKGIGLLLRFRFNLYTQKSFAVLHHDSPCCRNLMNNQRVEIQKSPRDHHELVCRDLT